MSPRAALLFVCLFAACSSSPRATTPTSTPTATTSEPRAPASAPALRPDAASPGPVIGEGGPLPRETIRRVILQHMPELHRCYLIGRSLKPDVATQILVQLVIDPGGHVSHVDLTRTPTPIVMGTCLMRELGQMTFPPPLGGGIVKVSYPLVFRDAP